MHFQSPTARGAFVFQHMLYGMGERVVVHVLDAEAPRNIHGVMVGKGIGGEKPSYKKDTVILHLGTGGFMVRPPRSDPSFYTEEEVQVTSEP